MTVSKLEREVTKIITRKKEGAKGLGDGEQGGTIYFYGI